MEKRTSAFARILAVVAIAAAIVAVIVVLSGAFDEDPAKEGRQGSGQQAKPEPQKPKFKAAVYEVKSGDTLTRISYLTGVKVTKLLELNPELDPQILEVGAKLKLR